LFLDRKRLDDPIDAALQWRERPDDLCKVVAQLDRALQKDEDVDIAVGPGLVACDGSMQDDAAEPRTENGFEEFSDFFQQVTFVERLCHTRS
jgi:hypothetical protein